MVLRKPDGYCVSKYIRCLFNQGVRDFCIGHIIHNQELYDLISKHLQEKSVKVLFNIRNVI